MVKPNSPNSRLYINVNWDSDDEIDLAPALVTIG